MKSLEKFPPGSKSDLQEPAKIRVLLSGALPPPVGGVGTYYQSLLGSSLPDRVNLLFVQTSAQNREASQTGLATFSNLIAAMRDCFRFFKAVIQHRPDICHISTAIGLSFLKHSICVGIARVFSKRVLLHPHCSLKVIYSDRPGWWRWYFRQVVRLTDGLIALSSEWKQISEIVPGSRAYFLPNAINLDPYKSIAKERLGNSKRDRAVRILYLGHIGRAKGSFDLLETAQRVHADGIEACFNIVGCEIRPGEVDQLLKQIEAAELFGIMKIHPPVSGAEKLTFFRDANIFVYPSHNEGMPMAVIEAMASGLPIVATGVGGLPDLVQNGVNGILVEPERPEHIADALCRLARDEELCNSMGKMSYQLACDRYDIEQHVTQLISVYQKVFSNQSILTPKS